MFTRIKRSAARCSLAALISAVLIGTGGFTPAYADVTAEFEAVSFAEAEAEAKAKAAAVGEVDVTARTLLEEERASMPASVIKKWKSPTKRQTRRHGTLVHTMDAAQRALNREIPVYLDIVNDARVRVAKAKLKLKYADTSAEKRKWKKRLVKAKKHRKAVFLDENWKFRPLIGADNGCFVNTGRNGNMILNSFTECIGGETNRAQVWFGYDINEEAVRVVLVVFDDGSIKIGCLNFADFNVPPNTPSEELFLVVEALVEVKVRVTVAVTVRGKLTVRGVMRRDGEICDSDEKTEQIEKTEYVEKTVSSSDVAQAMEFGENEVSANVELMESVMAEVKENAVAEIALTMTLSCEDAPPPYQCPPGTIWEDKDGDGKQEEGECVPPADEDNAPQITGVSPAHVYKGGDVYIWLEASDPDGDALSVNVVGDQYAHVSGVIPVSERWDGSACPSGKSCYRATLWGDNIGTAHIVATVTANGKSGTWSADVPVKADEFRTHQGHYTPKAYVVNGERVRLQ